MGVERVVISRLNLVPGLLDDFIHYNVKMLLLAAGTANLEISFSAITNQMISIWSTFQAFSEAVRL